MKKTLVMAVLALGTLQAVQAQNGNHGNRNDRWERDRGRYDDDDYNGNRGRSEKNIPKKVLNAFYSDNRDVRNVRWTKERNIYTAYFRGGSASYAANGARVYNNNNNGYPNNGYPNGNNGYPNGNNNGTYNNGSVPVSVLNAFGRDFPNASGVTWDNSNRGVWTATFKNGLFSGNQTVSYNRDGQQVNGNTNYPNTGGANTVPYNVQQAFVRDFSSARNVNWTYNSSNRTWTATFVMGIFSTNRSATYNENGDRM